MPEERDEHGEYNPDAGSTVPFQKGDEHPETGEEVKYHPCNAVLRHSYERYGEKRYCTGMAVKNFTKHGVETDYEQDDFCRHHQSRAHFHDQQEKLFTTGAFAESCEHVYQYMEPHKKLLAVDWYRGLLNESHYDFNAKTVDDMIDTTDSDITEAPSMVLPIPVPREHKPQAVTLWFAAINFVQIQNIHEEQFRAADEEGLAVGEKTFEKETESGEVMEVIDEHHLNLPLSRIQKDYEQHLKFGGVSTEADEDGDSVPEDRTWVVEIDKPEPEADVGSSPMADIELPEE